MNIKKIYIGISVIPLILFLISLYLNTYTIGGSFISMNQIAYASTILGVIGVLFIIRAVIKKEAILGWVIATLLSGSVALFFLYINILFIGCC